MKPYLFCLLFFCFFFFPVGPVSAWEIQKFDSNISIQNDGKVQITETIVADFGLEEKHGIFRDIPYEYVDENGAKTYTKLEVQSVTQDTKKAETKITTEDSFIRIRIGDPDYTITGKHTYTLTYLAAGVLRSYERYDELYWNVTGNYWDAEIAQATATVTLPGKGSFEKTACYEGYSESTVECKHINLNPRTTTFETTDTLGVSEGITIVAAYTKGTVPILTVDKPRRWEDAIFTKESLMSAIGAFILGSILVLRRWIKNGRDYWFKTRQILDPSAKHELMPIGAHETIVVEFESPERLRPAELGVLMDERADTLDITATIIDLATRGYLTITEEPKKWLFGTTDYTLTNGKGDVTKLLRFEKMLLDRLFSGKASVTVSSLKTEFYDDLAQVKKQLYEDVMSRRLFVGNPEYTRNMHLGMSIGGMVLGGFLIFLGVITEITLIMSVGFGIILSGIVGIVFSQVMPQRTALGRELYQRARGYRMFISGAEQYRQRFAEKKNLFNEILPYTIVFGLTDKFAKAMNSMGMQPQTTGWYSGTHAFNTHSFLSGINTFSSSMSKAIASTPSSKGGFSGGSSGGGFGGGGGGSW